MTQHESKQEYERVKANGLLVLIETAAKGHGIAVPVALALGSRETNLVNELGDGEHGIGILQIDRRYHPIAQQAYESGSWQTHPGPLIDYGMRLLAGNIAWAKRRWPDFDPVKIALSAYNAGQGGAERGVLEGDSDRHTTGGNYGKDVLARAVLFEKLLAEKP